jgi:hypothetical protein
MTTIVLEAYEDDDDSTRDPKVLRARANGHMEIYLTINRKKYLLMVGDGPDGIARATWDYGSFGGNGDPTAEEETSCSS